MIMKLSERSIRIKELISGQVDMGTFGLIELELIEFDKQIEELSKLHQPAVISPVCGSIHCIDGIGLKVIAAERQRQIEVEGYTPEHDAEHNEGELANAAAYYAMTPDMLADIDREWGNDMHLFIWPFELDSLKTTPKDRVRQLAKAGALIVSEIERLKNETGQ